MALELRAAQKREYIRVRVALKVDFTPISAETSRCLARQRTSGANQPWPALELPQVEAGSESEGLLEGMRLINDKLDYLLGRLCSPPRPGHQRSGTTVDVSGGGMCLETEQPLPPGQHLDMSLVLPTWPEIRLELLGLVRSVEGPPAGEEGGYRLGIRFSSLGEIDRDRLVRYIFQRQRECLRHGLKPA
jgi:c-di-GMP-binding flagellar brake protein YcgR